MYGYDLWFIDGFTNGYNIQKTDRVPTDFVGTVYVFEHIFFITPSVRVDIEDIGAVVFDKMKNIQLILQLTKDQGTTIYRWWDFAIVGQDKYRMDSWMRPASGVRSVFGVDMLLLWLSQVQTRSFGNCSASKVVKEVVTDSFQQYQGLGAPVHIEYNIDDSFDAGRYLQANVSSVRFLNYLRNVAYGYDKECSAYFLWIDRLVKGDKKVLRVNFKQLTELMKGEPKFVFEHTISPERLDEFLKDPKGNVIPFYTFSIWAKNESVLANKQEFNVFNFDFGRRMLQNKVVTLVDEVEKSALKKFYQKSWRSSYQVKGILTSQMDLLKRSMSEVMRSRWKRKIWILCPAVTDLSLGDKVRLIMPTGYKNELLQSLSGDWIVASIVHVISSAEYTWLMKVGLVGIEYNWEE